jgi:hypothetical protein
MNFMQIQNASKSSKADFSALGNIFILEMRLENNSIFSHKLSQIK